MCVRLRRTHMKTIFQFSDKPLIHCNAVNEKKAGQNYPAFSVQNTLFDRGRDKVSGRVVNEGHFTIGSQTEL